MEDIKKIVRKYQITWKPKGKYELERTNEVQINKPTGKVEFDAKSALGLFTKNFGSLTKNDIIRIKEFDGEGNQIGQDIVPTSDENAIIPSMPRKSK